MAKTKKQKRVDKKTLTFFLVGFPTLLIIILHILSPDSWWAMVLLAFYQFILLKQVLDDYYNTL